MSVKNSNDTIENRSRDDTNKYQEYLLGGGVRVKVAGA
jgi:hypothetical protein